MLRIQTPHLTQTPSSSSAHLAEGPKAAKVFTSDPQVGNGKVKQQSESTIIASENDLQDQVKELSGQVKDLSSQIAMLTALIMAQHAPIPQPGEDEDDEVA
jgi:hypothetical protein